MRIIIFGCGNIYRKYKNKLQNGVEIGGIIDHDEKLHGKKLDGIDVCYPKEIEKFDYDYIVLMSDSAPEMGEQLLQLGYSEKKIIHYFDFFGMFPCEMKKYAGVKNDNRISGKRLLIVSVTLSFTGVPIVSLLTAKAAVQLGYEVTIAADGGDIRYIQEAVNNGIDVLICDNLRNASLQRLSWTERYDKILVNSLPMIRLAVKLAKRREVNVWIHENPDEYERIRYWKREIEAGIQKETLRIYAPSKRAAYHFERWFGSQKEAVILPLGIEDRGDAGTFINKKICYGLVGELVKRKGQDVFMSAVEQLPENILRDSFFFLAGKKNIFGFGKEIVKRAAMINNCFLLGERTRQEMTKLYQMLDVVVVASREETVSMAAIESMMMGKVCIISNQTGMAEYIEQGRNGFIFQSENDKELNSLMTWCYQHQEQLKKIGQNARKTYELNFTMDIFMRNIQKILQ